MVHGALAAGFPGIVTVATTHPTVPAQIDMIRFKPLVGCLDVGAERDTLSGGTGDDDLIGDNAFQIAAVIDGGEGGGSLLLPQYRLDVEFDKLVGDVTLTAASDTMKGDDGNDCLIGDQALSVAGVLSGAQPDDGVRVDIEALANRITLKGGANKLEGGAGDDHLIGDSQVTLTGLIVTEGGQLGSRGIEVEGLLCALRIEAGADTLLGGDGNDMLIGDSAATFTGVALPEVRINDDDGGGTLTGTIASAAAPALPFLQVDGLVGELTILGNKDTLDGGAGDDSLYGDDHVTVVGVTGSPAPGESLRIEIECSLLGCVDITGNADKLTGGLGNDLIVGDSRLEMAAMAGGVSSGARLEIEVDKLAGNVRLSGGGDTAYGNDGDDRLVGDHEVVIAGLVLDAGVDGDLTMDVDGLVDGLTLETNCSTDTLDGGAGNDTLVGDNFTAIGESSMRSAVSSPAHPQGSPPWISTS